MFKGLGNLGNLASMMGSLKEMPDKMRELNERMKSEVVSATSGCQSIKVEMNGIGQVQSLKIEGELSGEELEHAIVEATNAAGAAAKQLYAQSVSQLASDMDLNIPGIDGMLASFTGGG